jgi:hypothetical protein
MAVNCLKDLIAKFFWNENDRCRFKLAHIRSYLWEEALMRSFLMAALAAAGHGSHVRRLRGADSTNRQRGPSNRFSRRRYLLPLLPPASSSSSSPLLVAPRSSALPLVMRRGEELPVPHSGRGAA